MKQRMQGTAMGLLVMVLAAVFAIGSVPITVQAANVTPRQVISSSDTHTMVIDANGTLWGWGSNEYGQVGDGTTTNRNRPVAIMQNVVYVEAVNGRTFAVNADGVLFAWGNNEGGLLGDGTSTNRHSPVQIHQGLLLSGTTPQPPVVQPTPPQRQGLPFFTTYNHFGESNWQASWGGRMGFGIATSLGLHYPNSLFTDWGPSFRDYNIDGQYVRLTGTVLRRDGSGTGPGSISFFGDGRELLTVTTNPHDQPLPISIDISGVRIIRIQISGTGSAFTAATIY